MEERAMVPFRAAWERTAEGLDWLIRGHFVVQLLIAMGIGKIVQWAVTKYAQVPQTLASAIWLIASGLAVWVLLFVFRKRVFVQSSSIEMATAPAGGIEDNIKSVTNFYKTGGGPFLDEMESHFQRLAAHHKDAKEREQFLIRALSGGAVSYLHDMTWSSIFKSQLEALHELNARGAMLAEQLKPFYTAASTAHPAVYRAYSFDSWLAYLIGQTLVRQDGGVIPLGRLSTLFAQSRLSRDTSPMSKPKNR